MKKLTHEEYLNQFNDISNGEYTLESEYTNQRTKILIKHIKCNNTFEMTPTNFKSGQRCPFCKEERKSKSLIKTGKAKTLKKLIEKCGKEYELVSEYKGYREELLLKHIPCGHIWKTKAINFLSQNNSCPKCARNEVYLARRKTHETFEKEFYEISNNEYELLSRYINKRTKIKIRHLKCGHVYETLPSTFITDRCGCPKCNESKGEREVRRFLDKYNLKYESKYRFDDCRNKNPLPFDFAVFNDDNTIKCLIEYQGIQHYKKTGYFKGEEKLKYTKKNDNIKEEFCKKNNYNLIIISYEDYPYIEKIIKECLGTFEEGE